MQTAITLSHRGLTLRGMEHMPNTNAPRVPAAVLFHGFTGTKCEGHRMFLKISRALESLGIASFRFDFIGSGESDGDFEEMTIGNEVSEAKAVLDLARNHPRVDPERVYIIGISMGGLVSSLVAGDRAQDVQMLVLLAPGCNLVDNPRHSVNQYKVDPATKVYDDGGNLVGMRFYEEYATINVYERAKSFDGPVLIIHGTKDLAIPYENSFKFRDISFAGRARLHLIEGADHTFNKHEWEQEAIREVCGFLA